MPHVFGHGTSAERHIVERGGALGVDAVGAGAAALEAAAGEVDVPPRVSGPGELQPVPGALVAHDLVEEQKPNRVGGVDRVEEQVCGRRVADVPVGEPDPVRGLHLDAVLEDRVGRVGAQVELVDEQVATGRVCVGGGCREELHVAAAGRCAAVEVGEDAVDVRQVGGGQARGLDADEAVVEVEVVGGVAGDPVVVQVGAGGGEAGGLERQTLQARVGEQGARRVVAGEQQRVAVVGGSGDRGLPPACGLHGDPVVRDRHGGGHGPRAGGEVDDAATGGDRRVVRAQPGGVIVSGSGLDHVPSEQACDQHIGGRPRDALGHVRGVAPQQRPVPEVGRRLLSKRGQKTSL